MHLDNAQHDQLAIESVLWSQTTIPFRVVSLNDKFTIIKMFQIYYVFVLGTVGQMLFQFTQRHPAQDYRFNTFESIAPYI